MVLLVASLQLRAPAGIRPVEIRRAAHLRLFQFNPPRIFAGGKGRLVVAAEVGDLVLVVAILAFERGLVRVLLVLDGRRVLLARGQRGFVVFAANAGQLDFVRIFKRGLVLGVPLVHHLDLDRVAGIELANGGLHLAFVRSLHGVTILAQTRHLVTMGLLVLDDARLEIVANSVEFQARAILDRGKTLLE